MRKGQNYTTISEVKSRHVGQVAPVTPSYLEPVPGAQFLGMVGNSPLLSTTVEANHSWGGLLKRS